jgi:ABC-2 type transport system ATP-binding protein
LLGLTSPTAGEVEIVGMTPRHAVEAGRVSAVMQTGGLLPDFTVGETVEAIAALHGRLDRVEEVIERTGLTVVRGRKVQACSGGEQQRLRFALALIPDPDVILLDEPTTGMDVAARQAFCDTMRADAATGRTIVFATHYLAEADAFAERTVLMARGRIVEDGPTADVRAAFGGRTVSFRPPAEVVRRDGLDEEWLARVRHALAPLGVDGVEVASASLEAAFLALTGEPVAVPTQPTLETTGAQR